MKWKMGNSMNLNLVSKFVCVCVTALIQSIASAGLVFAMRVTRNMLAHIHFIYVFDWCGARILSDGAHHTQNGVEYK